VRVRGPPEAHRSGAWGRPHREAWPRVRSVARIASRTLHLLLPDSQGTGGGRSLIVEAPEEVGWGKAGDKPE
jgi:hypothetical protein